MKRLHTTKIGASWRIGFIGWYEDETELADVLDTVYGKGNWRLAGRYLETYSDKSGWSSYYRVKRYDTGRYFVFDETKD